MTIDYNKIRITIIYNAVSKIINELSCPYCIIKGAMLSLLAYNNFSLRKSSDIDILISRKNLKFIEKELLEKDFLSSVDSRKDKIMCLSSSHQIPTYKKIISGIDIEVDVNYDIFWGEYTGKRINIDDFLSDAIEMNIYGVRVKTLTPLKAMVQLILHHYKEMNSIYHLASHDCIKLSMFNDVYYLWKNNVKTISLDKLYVISSEYEIIPYVFYVLYFTNEIFKDSELAKYIEVFRTPEGNNLIDYYGLTNKERKRWRVDFKTRLETENLYNLIKDDLTEADIVKLEQNRRIFG
jgi:hypothetical protein